jgi:hypothetical protein
MSATAAVPIDLTRPRRMTSKQLASYSAACALLLLLSLSWLGAESRIGYSAFGGYQASGQAAAMGLDPFAIYPETYRSTFAQRSVPDNNFNPPCLLPLFQALSFLPRMAYAWVWTAASFLAFAFTPWLLLRTRPSTQGLQIVWLLLCCPVINTITSGQIYGLLVLLAALACYFHHRYRKLAAAVAIGLLVACKPTMAFLLPFLWLARHRRDALYAAAVTCIASALPILFYGPRIYSHWITALRGDMHWLALTDIAPIAILRRHGHPHAGFAIAGAIAIALAWWQWKKRPGFVDCCGAAVCAGVLCAPLAWHAYILIAAPFFVARRWPLHAAFTACLLFFPLGLAPAAISTIYLSAVAIFLSVFLSDSG